MQANRGGGLKFCLRNPYLNGSRTASHVLSIEAFRAMLRAIIIDCSDSRSMAAESSARLKSCGRRHLNFPKRPALAEVMS